MGVKFFNFPANIFPSFSALFMSMVSAVFLISNKDCSSCIILSKATVLKPKAERGSIPVSGIFMYGFLCSIASSNNLPPVEIQAICSFLAIASLKPSITSSVLPE